MGYAQNAVVFSDEDRRKHELDYQNELVNRLQNGALKARADRKEARRILKERSAADAR